MKKTREGREQEHREILNLGPAPECVSVGQCAIAAECHCDHTVKCWVGGTGNSGNETVHVTN